MLKHTRPQHAVGLVRSISIVIACGLTCLILAQVVCWVHGPVVGQSADLSRCMVHLRAMGPVLARFHDTMGRWPQSLAELHRVAGFAVGTDCCPGTPPRQLVVEPSEEVGAVITCAEGYYIGYRYEQPLLLRTVFIYRELLPQLMPDGTVIAEPGRNRARKHVEYYIPRRLGRR